MKQKSFISKLVLGLSIFVIASLSFFGLDFLYQNNKEFKDTITLATTVRPETFTELYVDDHLELPSIVKTNQPYYFEFTIHNLENKDMNYSYEVYLQSTKIKLPIDQKTVTIKNGRSKTIREGFQVNAPITKSKIVVKLLNKNQEVDFWINK